MFKTACGWYNPRRSKRCGGSVHIHNVGEWHNSILCTDRRIIREYQFDRCDIGCTVAIRYIDCEVDWLSSEAIGYCIVPGNTQRDVIARDVYYGFCGSHQAYCIGTDRICLVGRTGSHGCSQRNSNYQQQHSWFHIVFLLFMFV